MTKRFRILLVEDNKLDQMAFERFVEHENLPYDYIIAGSVAEAKASLAAEQFDAIVTDYLLGDGTAFDLFGEMENLPTVVITGSGDESIAVKAMKAGANDYLIKDIDGHYLTTLPVTVENAIRFKQIQDELELYRQYLEELVEERTFELTRANVKLVTEIVERKQAEELLQQAHDELEMRVEERTAELAKTNKALRVEIEERKQAEVALRTSEERLSMFMESATDSFTLWDSEFNLVEINPVGLGLLAANREDVLGKNMLELSSKIEETGRYDTYRTVLETGDPAFLEDRVPRSTLGDVHLTWKVFRVGDGLGMIASDITERKRTEEFVRAQRDLALAISTAFGLDETLRLCLETAIRISDMDGGGIYLVDGTTGALDLALYQDMPPDFVSSASHYEADSSNARLVMAGRPVYSEHLHLGVPLNEVQRREALRAIAILPVRHENQVIACLNVASHTLDEVPVFARTVLETIAAQIGSTVARVQMEEALRESEDKFAKAFHSGPNLMAITRLTDGNIVDVNSSYSSTTGYSREELVGSSTTELNLWLEPEMRDSFVKAIREQGRVHNFEAIIRTKSGETRLVLLSGEMVNLSGEPHLITIASDITERKQAEEVIRKSEKQLKESQEAAKIGSWILNLVSNELEWSEKTYNLFDQDRNTFTPSFDEFARLVHPDDFETMQTQFNAALESDDHPYHVVIRIINDSEREWVMEAFGAVSRDKHGNPIRIAGTAQDVTERKRAEETLRESENRITNFFNLSADLICIADINGYFRLLNPAWEKVLGYSISELTSKPFLDFIHSDDVEKTLAVINEKLERGESILTFENRYVCKDGSIIWLDWTSQPSVEEGQVFAIARDITERKRDEEERERLLAAEREQRLLAETLYEVTLALTSQTSHHQAVLDEILRQTQRLVPYNAANIVLLDAVHNTLRIACRQGYETFGSEELVSNLVQSLADFPLDAEVIRSQKSLVIPDVHQEPRWVTFKESAWIKSHIVVPICHRNRVLGLLRLDSDTPGQFFPIDAERLQPLANAAAIALENARLYDQALQDARIKTELLKEVNHRVKNNLMAISGLFQAEKHHASAEAQAPVAAAMTRLNRHLQGLAEVHSILSQSEWGPVLLSNLVDRIIHLALKPLLTNDQQVQVEVAQSSIEVSPRQAGNLTLVINELATNTAKHTLLPDAGQATIRITVSLALDGDMIRIEYRDNGPGYPAKVLSLGRDDVTGPQSPGKAGLSVGLYLTRRIVAGTLRGRLSLTNNNGAVTTIQFKTEERNTT